MPYLNITPKVTRGSITKTSWQVHVIVMCPDRVTRGTAASLFVSARWVPSLAEGPVELNLIRQSSGGGHITFDAAGLVTTRSFTGDFHELIELHGQVDSPGSNDVTLQVKIDGNEKQRISLSVGAVSTSLAIRAENPANPPPELITLGSDVKYNAEVSPPSAGTYQWVSLDDGVLAIRSGATESRVTVRGSGSPGATRKLFVLFTPSSGPAVMQVQPIAAWAVTDPSTNGSFAIGAMSYGTDGQHNRVQLFDTNGSAPKLDREWGSSGAGASQFNHPEGIATNATGDIYVADRDNNRIQQFDENGTFLHAWGSSGTGNGEFDHPTDVAVNSAGNIFVTDRDNHRVQQFSPTGTFVRMWGSSGSADGEFNHPTGIALNGAGHVFVTDQDNHRVQEFTATGTFVRKWGTTGSADGEFNRPAGIALNATGNVLVADRDNHRVQEFDGTGAFVRKWGSSGTGNGEFDRPAGIAVNAAGNVFVTDQDNHRVQEFDATGTFVRRWGSSGTELGQFNHPSGIAVNTAGDLLIVDRDNNRIQQSIIQVWGNSGSADGEFNHPTGIAVNTSGNIFVADRDNHRVQEFTAAGAFVRTWGSSGSADGEFNHPTGIAVNAAGNVFVTDQDNHRVQEFDATGTFVRKWGSSGTGNGRFDHPTGIAVNAAGNIFVTDRDNHRVQQFTATGTFVRKWGSSGTGNRRFDHPTGIAVNAAGNIFVTDRDNHRVQQFTATGTFVRKWGSSGTGNGEFDHPAGIAVNAAGNVFVIDQDNHRIQQFTATGTLVRVWGSIGAATGQFNHPTGIVVNAAGAVFVTDRDNHRIQRFEPDGASPSFGRQWGSFGETTGQFNNLAGIAVHPTTGDVYVTDRDVDRIQQFDKNGTFVRTWGTFGTTNSKFNRPTGIAISSGGDVYVADKDNHRIQQFSATGAFVRKWGAFGTADGQFKSPTGIAVSSGGKVYVADQDNHRIQQFSATGAFVRKWGLTNSAGAPVAGGGLGAFNHPIGIAVNAAGNVFVTDRDNHRVQEFDATGASIGGLGGFGTGNGEFRRPMGITIDGTGRIYVTGCENNRVQRFASSGAFELAWGGFGAKEGRFGCPTDLAVDDANNVYVTDARPFFVIPAATGIQGETLDQELLITMEAIVRYPADVAGTDVPVSARQRTYPLVILAHGNHSSLTWKRIGTDHIEHTATFPRRPQPRRLGTGSLVEFPSHLGHVYHAEHLASHGFIAISVNLNGAFNNRTGAGDLAVRPGSIITCKPFVRDGSGIAHRGLTLLRHLQEMRRRNTNVAVLKSHIDLEQIAMVGHSRGGEAVVLAQAINGRLPATEQANVRVLVSIAPTDFRNVDVLIPYLVIISSDDGDVRELQGLRLYDRARTPKHMTWVVSGIHNRFNSRWRWQDEVPAEPLITEIQHQDIARAYTLAFLHRYMLSNVGGLLSFFTGEQTPTALAAIRSKLHFAYGAPANTSTVVDNFEDLPADKNRNTMAGAVTVQDIPNANYDEADLQNLANPSVGGPPGCQRNQPSWFQDSRGLLIEWATVTARYTTTLRNVTPSDHAILSFDVGHDPSVTPPGSTIDFRVEVRDLNGETANLRVSAFTTLPQPRTKTIYKIYPLPATARGTMTMTFLKTIRMPLASFKTANNSLNVQQLGTITFVFSERSRGKIGIGTIEIID